VSLQCLTGTGGVDEANNEASQEVTKTTAVNIAQLCTSSFEQISVSTF